jgi:hypothetical protein
VPFEGCQAVPASLPEARAVLMAADASMQRFNFAYNTAPRLEAEQWVVACRGAALHLCSALPCALIASGAAWRRAPPRRGTARRC